MNDPNDMWRHLKETKAHQKNEAAQTLSKRIKAWNSNHGISKDELDRTCGVVQECEVKLSHMSYLSCLFVTIFVTKKTMTVVMYFDVFT